MPKSRKNPVKNIKNRTCKKLTHVEQQIRLKRFLANEKVRSEKFWGMMEKAFVK